MKKKGGKLIYKGSKVCLFTPELPCKTNSNKKKKTNKNPHIKRGQRKRLSKIIFSRRKEKYQRELILNKKIKSIQNYSKFFIIFDTFCKSMDFDDIYNVDKDILKCTKDIDINDFNKYSYLLQGN